MEYSEDSTLNSHAFFHRQTIGWLLYLNKHRYIVLCICDICCTSVHPWERDPPSVTSEAHLGPGSKDRGSRSVQVVKQCLWFLGSNYNRFDLDLNWWCWMMTEVNGWILHIWFDLSAVRASVTEITSNVNCCFKMVPPRMLFMSNFSVFCWTVSLTHIWNWELMTALFSRMGQTNWLTVGDVTAMNCVRLVDVWTFECWLDFQLSLGAL